MNFEESKKYCESFSINKSSNSLDNIKRILKLLGNPEKECRYIHVAGTNGKGSVVSYITEILVEAGYKTGKFISPHLNMINERISINGNQISNQSFTNCIRLIKNTIEQDKELEHQLTMFEILTCIAFLHFKDNKCNVCVLETGLGGRLDATNVLENPLVTVITRIGYDHVAYLGDTIEDITKEKAAIFKQNGTCVIAPQIYKNVNSVLMNTSVTKNCDIIFVDKKQISVFEKCIYSQKLRYKNMNDLEISLLGEHQTENAATAIEAVLALEKHKINVPSNAIYSGLKKTAWKCRLELVREEPITFIDGAHNIDGVRELVKFLEQSFANKKITYIFGVMKDKQYKEMIDLIKVNAKTVYAVNVNNIRALDSVELCSELNDHGVSSISFATVQTAITYCYNNTVKNDVICIFGSLYMAGEAREYILNKYI